MPYSNLDKDRTITTLSILCQAFRAGWDAGFQEAHRPDEHPDRDRCADALAAYLTPLAKRPDKEL